MDVTDINFRSFVLTAAARVVNRQPESLRQTGYAPTAQWEPVYVVEQIRELVEDETHRRMTVRLASNHLLQSGFWQAIIAGQTQGMPKSTTEEMTCCTAGQKLYGLALKPRPRCVEAAQVSASMMRMRERQAAQQARIRGYQRLGVERYNEAHVQLMSKLKRCVQQCPDPIVRQDALVLIGRLQPHSVNLLEVSTICSMLGMKIREVLITL